MIKNLVKKLVGAEAAAPDPEEMRATVLARSKTERVRPSTFADYTAQCKPLFPAATKLPADLKLTAHADLRAFAINESMRVYFQTAEADGGFTITDNYPTSHFYSRQHMLYAAYKTALGAQGISGCSVLDIGCSSGYYSFHATRLGAARVQGIDARPEHEEQFRVLHGMLKLPDSCSYKNVDMEYGLEQLQETYDVLLAQGVMYHVYDHPRFFKNLFRMTNKLLILEGGCSGRPDRLCYPDIERTGHLRYSIHGPVLYPSVPWTIELLEWVGFKKILYIDLPDGIHDGWGFQQLKRVMLVAIK